MYIYLFFLQAETISAFTSEPALLSFAEFFCKTSEEMKHVSLNTEINVGVWWNQFFSLIAYTCSHFTVLRKSVGGFANQK